MFNKEKKLLDEQREKLEAERLKLGKEKASAQMENMQLKLEMDRLQKERDEMEREERRRREWQMEIKGNMEAEIERRLQEAIENYEKNKLIKKAADDILDEKNLMEFLRGRENFVIDWENVTDDDAIADTMNVADN